MEDGSRSGGRGLPSADTADEDVDRFIHPSWGSSTKVGSEEGYHLPRGLYNITVPVDKDSNLPGDITCQLTVQHPVIYTSVHLVTY